MIAPSISDVCVTSRNDAVICSSGRKTTRDYNLELSKAHTKFGVCLFRAKKTSSFVFMFKFKIFYYRPKESVALSFSPHTLFDTSSPIVKEKITYLNFQPESYLFRVNLATTRTIQAPPVPPERPLAVFIRV